MTIQQHTLPIRPAAGFPVELSGALDSIFANKQAGIAFRPLTKADLEAIQLRPEDLAECRLGGTNHVADLFPRIQGQWAMVATGRNDAPVAVFGVSYGAEPAATVVSPWLLCTARANKHRATLLRLARRVAQTLSAHSPAGALITNRISKVAQGSRALIQSLGFAIHSMPGPFDLFIKKSHV